MYAAMVDCLRAVGSLGLLRMSLLAICVAWSSLGYADIYRCDDAPDVITLSNIQKGKNCKKMKLPPPEKRAKPATPSASSSKGEDATTAKTEKTKSKFESAQAERKRIIEEELGMEQDRLDAINAKITSLNSPSNKSTNKTKELASLQKKQSLHQGNIELLQKELKKQ